MTTMVKIILRQKEYEIRPGMTSIYYKEILNKLENDRAGAKLTFYLSFLEARKKGLFAEQIGIQQGLHPCPSCGQPTSAPGMCSFCRMMEKVAPAAWDGGEDTAWSK